MSRVEEGEAPHVPRHLAPKHSRSSRPDRDDESGRLGRLPLRLIALGVALVMALAIGVVLLGGSGSDGDDGGGSDRVATGSDGDSASNSDGDSDAGAATAGESASGEVPSVERPARPVNAPVLLDVAPSSPVSVEIPSLGVTSTLEDLAIAPDGVLGAPTDFAKAGWFTEGPQPGQAGPAVIAGHVDSRAGPAVFFRLSEVQPGAVVLVHREDGSTVTFSVVETEQYPKDAFPSSKVYGPTPGPELRLITCGGVFDAARHSYRDNIVVYATALAS